MCGTQLHSFCCHPLLGDGEVSPINCHETVIEGFLLFFTVKVDLQLRGWQEVGVWGRVWKKKGFFLTGFYLRFLMLANIGLATESEGIITKKNTITVVFTLWFYSPWHQLDRPWCWWMSVPICGGFWGWRRWQMHWRPSNLGPAWGTPSWEMMPWADAPGGF